MKMNQDSLPQLAADLSKFRKQTTEWLKEFDERLKAVARESGQDAPAMDPQEWLKAEAERWHVPKIDGDRAKILGMSVIDILPKFPAEGVTQDMQSLVTRIISFLKRCPAFSMLRVIVEKSPEELMKYGKVGTGAVELLRICLEWNGLSFSLSAVQHADDFKAADTSLDMGLSEFFRDQAVDRLDEFLRVLREKLYCETVSALILYSRKDFRKYSYLQHFPPQVFDAIDHKLATIGRSLRM